MKLNEISQKDVLTQTFVKNMIERSTVLEFAEFYSIVGNADYTRKASSASGGRFRELNQDYPTNAVSPAYANPTLKIFGDKVQVDRAHERRGLDVASVRARELVNFAKSLGKQFQYYFFLGDGTNGTIAGLKNIISESETITAATNGLAVPLGNDNTSKTTQQKFLELIDKLIQSVEGGAQVIFMNPMVLSRLTSIAREYIKYETNEFGTPVPFYNGVPLRSAGYSAQGEMILDFNETVGTSNDCSSIYAVRFGEAADLSVATNIGVEIKDLGLVGNYYTHSVDFDIDLVLLNQKSAARLKGIKLAS
jgi:hypothetical protein